MKQLKLDLGYVGQDEVLPQNDRRIMRMEIFGSVRTAMASLSYRRFEKQIKTIMSPNFDITLLSAHAMTINTNATYPTSFDQAR